MSAIYDTLAVLAQRHYEKCGSAVTTLALHPSRCLELQQGLSTEFAPRVSYVSGEFTLWLPTGGAKVLPNCDLGVDEILVQDMRGHERLVHLSPQKQPPPPTAKVPRWPARNDADWKF